MFFLLATRLRYYDFLIKTIWLVGYANYMQFQNVNIFFPRHHPYISDGLMNIQTYYKYKRRYGTNFHI